MVSNRATHHIKLTASVKVILCKALKSKNLLCKQQSWGCQTLFNHSNENMNMSVFFVDCHKIPFWSVLSLNCCCLFKIYTSYISKYRSVKMINIPWFWVPHFYLSPVQSYKCLKLRAIKEWLFGKTNGRQIRASRINTFANVLTFMLRELKDILVYLLKLPLWAAQKWLFHSP